MTTNTNPDTITAGEALNRALKQARGCYQRAVLRGSEPLSGAGIVGKAGKYADLYARSRANLLARCHVVSVLDECLSKTGARTLVYGCAAVSVAAWTDEVKAWSKNWPDKHTPSARRLGELALAIESASFEGDEAGAVAAASVAIAALEAMRAEYRAHVGPQEVVAVLGKYAA